MKIGTVPSASLTRIKRVAQLSIDGRLQMQQRLIFHLSRYAPSLDVLRMATAALDLEMQAQTDWLEAANSKGQPLDDDAVLAQELAFDEFMSASMTESSSPAEQSEQRPSRRELLSHPNSAPAVIRDVQRAIQQFH